MGKLETVPYFSRRDVGTYPCPSDVDRSLDSATWVVISEMLSRATNPFFRCFGAAYSCRLLDPGLVAVQPKSSLTYDS